MCGASGIEHADDVPPTFADPHLVADVGLIESLAERFADHNLALSRREPSACNQFHVRTHFDAGRTHETRGDVHLTRAVLAWKNDHKDGLSRNHRFTFAIAGDA